MPGHPYPDELALDIGLSNFSVQALMLSPNFVANQIAPVVSTSKISGQFSRYVPEEGVNIEHHEKLGKGGIATEMDFRIEKDFYATEESAKRHFVSDREVANADVQHQDYIKGDRLILANIGTIREYELASLILNPASYYGGAAGDHVFAAAAAWDTDDGDPHVDLKNAVRQIRKDSGFTPNFLLTPPNVYDSLTGNSEVKELIKYTGGIPFLQTGRIPNDTIFNLKIINAGAIYDTNGPLETADLQFLWENAGVSLDDPDNWAIVCYVDPTPSLKTGTFCSQFAFNMNRISDQDVVSFYVYRDEHRRGEWREARTDYQVQITNNRAAALITDVITGATS